MKIAAIQFGVELGNPDTNYGIARTYMEQAAAQGASLLVLPEMWNTGFYPDNVRDLADQDGARTQQFLSAFAAQHHVHILGGSVACRRADKLYNTTYAVDRTGQIVSSYDKAHLFTLGKEDAVFTPGDHANRFTLDGVPMSSVICYDLRFCEWVRCAVLDGAQILFVPAAWPMPRLRHWQMLNIARAIENQCFVVAVNACGVTGSYHFAGHSMIIDPLGQVLAEAGEADEILLTEVDAAQAGDVRRGLTVFADRRPGLYGDIVGR